ncbi:undecaprenyl-diphosphate phosphatase [Seleniivibrio woodruffii]|uniref:Undecaprenyl-diphosphatase n=1 Tax=Seleniivibrio woodruffii TaxID=1078050 RepID=A0A4R1KF72_9BACT|nr:undecaprenyl-diphosphate phosphatase [Seleniivibrio woodruffii]TCK62673.1 undecaprenyl-diphosphatase [Seleniivibrio woodruffii]TVZ36901.1 undecaprenyl-diphosphatase [Seleniivibrio woodruffii]
MDILHVIVLSIVEGLTEFLPISSTGHMIAAAEFMKLPQTTAVEAFEVIIQLGAILAVAVDYKSKFTREYIPLWFYIILSFIPVGFAGLLFHEQVKALFSVKVVAVMLIVGGVLFIIAELIYRRMTVKVHSIEQLGFRNILIAGLSQILALIPGTSRAGVVILGAMFSGAGRKASTELSFLMALPVMTAAAGFDLLKNFHELKAVGFSYLGLGFVIAFISAYASIRFFIKFVRSHTFIGFGVYRIIFGVLLLYLFG